MTLSMGSWITSSCSIKAHPCTQGIVLRRISSESLYPMHGSHDPPLALYPYCLLYCIVVPVLHLNGILDRSMSMPSPTMGVLPPGFAATHFVNTRMFILDSLHLYPVSSSLNPLSLHSPHKVLNRKGMRLAMNSAPILMASSTELTIPIILGLTS